MYNYGLIPNIGIPELILLLVLALIIFGPGKLPEVGKSIGKSIREFKKASSEVKEELVSSVSDEASKQVK